MYVNEGMCVTMYISLCMCCLIYKSRVGSLGGGFERKTFQLKSNERENHEVPKNKKIIDYKFSSTQIRYASNFNSRVLQMT